MSRRCVEQGKKRDSFATLRKSSCHFVSNEPAEGLSAKKVGPLGLHAANVLKILHRHVLDTRQTRMRPIQPTCLQSIEGMRRSHMPSQIAKTDNVAAHPVNAEKRGLFAFGLDRDYGRPIVREPIALKRRTQLFHRRCLEQHCQW